ncbi:hypothetical protein [Massilia sp. LC238]|jgi:hypothetical protein|uniref:hypothetical protein n=1 Tax=Massilia sp. LC238 TaxID=1502852 RepID=UPI0004E2D7DB|nr:hypothetical protein [Massilia sp. LC238]KFC72673.1 hypothetical protein FG94_01850 [Massilia sp. LC238]
MDPLQTSPDITVLDNGTVLTADGLALKGTDAVEIINVRLENRVDAAFHSWQVCRLVRRDFNFVATKLFHRERRKGGREQVRSLLHEVQLQAELLELECQSFEAPPEGPGRAVPLRLVSPTAAGLFKAFQKADAAFARLNHAVANRKLAENLVHGYTHPFESAFSDLKLYCSARNQSEKLAREMAEAEGIA